MLLWKGTILGSAVGRRLLQNTRWNHAAAFPAPLERAMEQNGNDSAIPATPETHFTGRGSKDEEFEAPSHFRYFGVGPMELMAVPKKKVSRHKKGIRNGPKALKPIPVIIRCKSCGRVKLPHFYCCSGDRGSSEGKNSSG